MNTNIKPKCPLVGANGNIFVLMAIASRILKRAGMYKQADEMIARVTRQPSYYDALNVICEYVEPISTDDDTDDTDEEEK